VKDTLPVQRFPPGTMVREVKVRLDGSEVAFDCELLGLSPNVAVVLFRIPGGSSFHTPVHFPPGSLSYGYFWKRRPYNAYRIIGPDGSVIAHRFDAVTDVSLSPGEIRYRDLVLDWWILPGRELLEEDRDEFLEAIEAGLIAPPWVREAEAAGRTIRSQSRRLVREMEGLEQSLLSR
jgi:hypothetical protein